jgi:hypothetical protein
VFPVRYELGFISQKTTLFMITAVKTSNLTELITVQSRRRQKQMSEGHEGKRTRKGDGGKRTRKGGGE